MEGMANTGLDSNKKICIPAPVMQAKATGIIDLGENSNNNNSMASKIAASGLPKIAAIPAQAPAVKMIFLSAGDMCMAWPVKDPKAPPVAMIGPSAPNGPPVPIDMAADKGFKKVIIGGILLSSKIIFSIASGMPCPLIAFEPYLAISPTRILPAIGIKITNQPN